MMVTRRISLEKIGDLQNKKFPESKFFVDFWHREKYREKLTVPILDEKGGPVDGKSQERFHKRDCYCEAAYYRYKPAVSLAEVTGNQMHLIPEFIKKGIKDGGFRKRFDERFIKYILVSVGQALSLLHESRIAYGNLRPDTISLTTDLNVILPRICYIEPQFSDSFRWRSPELVQMYNSISSESTISSKSQKNMEKKIRQRRVGIWMRGVVSCHRFGAVSRRRRPLINWDSVSNIFALQRVRSAWG
ncbi:hypothetical protein AGDE_15264 [Angomonas deanei]|uniref:Protein kinase domain-containing protein n=1 Tax=Angomonas deanei TaxID=59799 RepID=A0A7G2CTT6_9TRYP|nr:hypothetical protein AGDE_15264 [Angomonas deanei]CAD2222709.1 hypothetical protein, conserved [Angomonas deanei]|eukprot:EPY19385.1 hypothetical protein AGDE_15264 [Angomonas deanei]